ncbi:MAG TPA: PaeR7I family type II restriction endonuclease [Candidatus Polarisedimenticolia bacterium]|nr:PaeR7I family type II restriction endonuclease [Candidatus Polarisedimenticolia bacterium]
MLAFTLGVMGTKTTLAELAKYTREAVRFYWQTRTKQSQKQRESGGSDQGLRSAVTGGAQMDGFIELLTKLVIEAGIDRSHIYYKNSLELPGYFRPTKQWDFIVVVNSQLVAALEAKSQVGPSFGNNFNNRTEEAMGSALDLWTAFRESAFGSTVRPWIGYMFLLEDCSRSTAPVGIAEPHFKVFPEFRKASYAQRYELFCRRLVLEKHYDASAFLMSNAAKGLKGDYAEPAKDLTFQSFANSLVAHVAAFTGRIKQL